MANLKFLKRIGYSNINTLDDDDSAFFYESALMIGADGAYYAYHPEVALVREPEAGILTV